MRFLFITLLLVLGTVAVPFFAGATSFSQSITLILPSNGSQYTLSNGASFDTLTINSNSFTVVLKGGDSLEIISGDKYTLSNDGNVSTSCNSGDSRLFLSAPSGGSSKTIIVTPSTTACSSSSSGSSGSSSGGGGGGSVSLGATFGGGGGSTPPPAPTPAPPPIKIPPPAPIPQIALSPVLPGASSVGSSNVVAVFAKDLVYGQKNDDVARLQALLATDKKIYPEGQVNGNFGPATQRAVKRFQAKYGLSQVGRVGPATRAKLNEVFGSSLEMPLSNTTPSPLPSPSNGNTSALFANDLSLGMKNNDDVLRLQTLLASDKDIYPEGILSGNFGPATLRAVKRFQAKYGITQVGRVGPATRAKLNEVFGTQSLSSPMAPPTSQSSSADDAVVQQLQQQLQTLQNQLKTMSGQ